MNKGRNNRTPLDLKKKKKSTSKIGQIQSTFLN